MKVEDRELDVVAIEGSAAKDEARRTIIVVAPGNLKRKKEKRTRAGQRLAMKERVMKRETRGQADQSIELTGKQERQNDGHQDVLNKGAITAWEEAASLLFPKWRMSIVLLEE